MPSSLICIAQWNERPLTPADRVDRRRRRVTAFLHAQGGRGLAPRGRQWLQREVRQKGRVEVALAWKRREKWGHSMTSEFSEGAGSELREL